MIKIRNVKRTFFINKPKNYFKDFASQHPSKLRFENNENKKMLKLARHFFIISLFIRDRGRIRTLNPQSRNLIFYPVELRSQF